MLVKPGDTVTVKETSLKHEHFKTLADLAEKRLCPVWLDRDVKKLSGRVLRLPERSEIEGSLNEQLIVEYYSR